MIKKLGHRPEFVLPDRNSVGMGVPFMRAYAELLVATCHRRGAHAIGGMAAFIPSRRDAEVNASRSRRCARTRSARPRRATTAPGSRTPTSCRSRMEVFDRVLGERPNQLDVLREDVVPDAAALLDVAATPGEVTLDGLRNDISVAIQYIAAWLRGAV